MILNKYISINKNKNKVFINKTKAFMDKAKVFLDRIKVSFDKIKHKLLEQFNKNIYTKLLFTNVIVFGIALLLLINFSNYMVKQSVYSQIEQDLLRKSKRVNYALSKETTGLDSALGSKSETEQELLKFLADSFDARITIFNQEGTILGTSAEQEIVPGSKVDDKFIVVLTSGKTTVVHKTDSETGQLTFTAVIPMGDAEQAVENGILLESYPTNTDLILNKMRSFLFFGGIIILLVVIVVSVYLAMCISKPITRLATSIAEYNGGNYILNNEKYSLDEINVISEQIKKLTVSLENIQSKSSKIEEERTRLFAEMSHELRTPLTAVQGFAEAIRDGMVEDKALQNKYLDLICTQTLHITRLVDDILVLNRLESGDITVEKLPLDLADLARGVIMSMEGIAEINNSTILFMKKSDKSAVLGDVDRMEQVIRNLLKNAINATDNGSINVSIEAYGDEVQLIIKDDGVGISPDELPHIWERFYTVKNQHNADLETKGTGLGLVIVKKLVQLQDGNIDVKSQLGKGTEFRLGFPAFTSNSELTIN
jgi:signal transduction histidine kinase